MNTPPLTPLTPLSFKSLTPRVESFRSSFDFDFTNRKNENDADMEEMFETVEKSIDDLYKTLKVEEKELKEKSSDVQGKYDQYETYHHISQMKHHLKRALYHRRRFSTVPVKAPATSMEESLETLVVKEEVEENEDGVVLRRKHVVNLETSDKKVEEITNESVDVTENGKEENGKADSIEEEQDEVETMLNNGLQNGNLLNDDKENIKDNTVQQSPETNF